MNLSSAMKESRVVMRGNLNEFNAASILQVLSISRQFTAVRFLVNDAQAAGRVFIKSGVVVQVDLVGEGSEDVAPTSSTEEGTTTFNKLMEQRLRFFEVYRLDPLKEYPAPVGQLSQLLLQCPAVGTAPSEAPPKPSQPFGPERGTSKTEVLPPADAKPDPADARSSAASAASAAPAAPKTAAVPAPPAPARAPAAPSAAAPPAAAKAPVQSKSPPKPKPKPRAEAAAVSKPKTRIDTPTGGVVLAIASPKGGCGKTTIAFNLAVSLARSGFRVTLVDTDPNGDVLSAIAARDRVDAGIYDALTGDTPLEPLVLKTVIPTLRILPAMGAESPLEMLEQMPKRAQWQVLFSKLQQDADIVVVDTSAGMFGISAEVLRASDYALGVLQAEVIPKRSFGMFRRALEAMSDAPEVLGVLLNMFRRNQGASISVLADAASELPADWLFQTTIPRNDAFMDANDAGMPLRMLSEDAAPAVSWLFDMLAGEVRDRLGIAASDVVETPTSFLI